MEKLPHYYSPWIVLFQKYRQMQDAYSADTAIWRITSPPFGYPRGVFLDDSSELEGVKELEKQLGF